MAVEFRLLGDVEALSDEQRLDIGPSRQRCVLVALLVDVNHPVPTDQLIDRVWADDRPQRARNALAGYLSRLRQVIASDAVAITREPGGYVLKTDPSSIDLHRFRELTNQARGVTNPAERDVLFGQALALWRSDPFATLDTPWVNEVRTALLAERLAVVLDHNDTGLHSGRHGELLPKVAAMLHDQPLDERLAGQLMLAQYRCGRQANAINTFREMRERLVDELGVDPSPPLRAVYQQILDGDPATEAVPRASIPARPRAVLPRRATSFVGRGQDLLRISDTLREGPLVTLAGVGGVGKTRLALEVAEHEQNRFADGVSICELAPIEDGSAVTYAVAAALHLQQQQGLSIKETVIEYLRTRELLLVVDNCEHVLDDAAGLLDQIAMHCPGVSILATSREALGVAGERILPVDPLPNDDATVLFVDRARASRPDFHLDHEPVGAVREICRQLDGLPLAIELAAARMRVMSSLDMARRLDSLRLLSGGARGALPRQQSLAATIDWSYRLLSEPEQSLFARLSVFAGGFDVEAAHAVCGEYDATEADTLDLLASLVDKSMVTVRVGGPTARYSVLESLRAYGRECLQANGTDRSHSQRHAAYYTGLAERAAAGMHSFDEQACGERMLPDYDNLRAAFERAMSEEDIDLALRLVTSLPEFVHLRIGYESSGWAERTLQLADRDHPLFAAAVGFAARGAWNRGDFSHARSLAMRAEGRVPGRGNGRVAYPGDVLADLALYEGDPRTALDYYEGEMARARGDEDPIRLVWTLFYIAICQSALRAPEKGVAAAEEAVRVSAATANPTSRSMACYALGLVLKKSDPDQALTLFDEAADLAASVQNFWWHGIALMEAASTRAVHSDPATAARELIAVLDHWDRVGDWSQQWLNLRYVTRFLDRMGADDNALALHVALVDAGRSSPLNSTQLARLGSRRPDRLSAVEAVVRARSALSRYI